MADYYRKLLANESDYLTDRIVKYSKILDDSAEKLSEPVVGQIRLAIGQSNLFINERFKQFSGLIDDCLLKRGEKEIKVEDLAGFWDMIYYQVEDLKTKYLHLEQLERNDWLEPEPVKPAKPVLINDNKVNIIKNKKVTNGKSSPPGDLKNGVQQNSTTTNDGVASVANKKPAARSNFREFLKNKRKEAKGSSNALSNGSIAVNGSSNGHHHNGSSEKIHSVVTNGSDNIDGQKVKNLTESMRQTLTVIDETNKEN